MANENPAQLAANHDQQAAEAANDNQGPAAAPAIQPAPAKEPATSTGYVIDAIKDPFDEDAFKAALGEHLEALAKKHNVDAYTIVYLLDAKDSISPWHSNRIYKATSAANKAKDILLIAHSPGGSIEPAYLISKTCKRLAQSKFVVAVPRRAKSAATLLALGADEIHMGLMSELGPIDPQINGFPALGVRNALEIFAELSCNHPGSATMLADYMKDKLDLPVLGYFERINESAMQYAERLLTGKKLPSKWTAQSLANHFVNHYKDHGFVIDFDEARDLLGDAVKQETSEYAFANAVFESFDFFRFCLDFVGDGGRDLDIVGSLPSALRVFKRPKKH